MSNDTSLKKAKNTLSKLFCCGELLCQKSFLKPELYNQAPTYLSIIFMVFDLVICDKVSNLRINCTMN